MQRRFARFLLPFLFLLAPATVSAQENQFRWVDFHSDKDESYVTWVTRSLASEKWTSIREIGILYDAALVVTSDRKTPDASPATDSFQVWSVSLANHRATPILKGVNLRWLDWLQLGGNTGRELAFLFDDCRDCAATTFLSAFHYDTAQHLFVPRWLRGNGQTLPVWSSNALPGVEQSQVYAVLTDLNGFQYIATWSHLDYGKTKPAEDYLYRYDLEPFMHVERTQLVSGKEVEPLKQKLCTVAGAAQGLMPGMARGQDSALCVQTVRPAPQRRVVTTPPANAQGRSQPPGSRK
jgi:hypothetical protein